MTRVSLPTLSAEKEQLLADYQEYLQRWQCYLAKESCLTHVSTEGIEASGMIGEMRRSSKLARLGGRICMEVSLQC